MTAVRGFLAPWIGGASLPASTPGYRSLLAFWAGGALISGQVLPPVVPPQYYGTFNWLRADDQRRQLLKEDEEFLVIISAAMRVIV
jgi:hypothetical protein